MFCAICVEPIIGEPRRAPLGRDGALVAICAACEDEHPRSGRYSFGGSGEVGRGLNIAGANACGSRGRQTGRRKNR